MGLQQTGCGGPTAPDSSNANESEPGITRQGISVSLTRPDYSATHLLFPSSFTSKAAEIQAIEGTGKVSGTWDSGVQIGAADWMAVTWPHRDYNLNVDEAGTAGRRVGTAPTGSRVPAKPIPHWLQRISTVRPYRGYIPCTAPRSTEGPWGGLSTRRPVFQSSPLTTWPTRALATNSADSMAAPID